VPANDPMTVLLGTTTQSLTKVNLYRAGVDQPPAAVLANIAGTSYCLHFAQIGPTAIINNAPLTNVAGTSPVPAVGNTLYTFLASRANTSFGTLLCTALLNAPVPFVLTNDPTNTFAVAASLDPNFTAAIAKFVANQAAVKAAAAAAAKLAAQQAAAAAKAKAAAAAAAKAAKGSAGAAVEAQVAAGDNIAIDYSQDAQAISAFANFPQLSDAEAGLEYLAEDDAFDEVPNEAAIADDEVAVPTLTDGSAAVDVALDSAAAGITPMPTSCGPAPAYDTNTFSGLWFAVGGVSMLGLVATVGAGIALAKRKIGGLTSSERDNMQSIHAAQSDSV